MLHGAFLNDVLRVLQVEVILVAGELGECRGGLGGDLDDVLVLVL